MHIYQVALIIAVSASAANAQRPIAQPVGVVRAMRANPSSAPKAITPAAAARISRTARAGLGALVGGVLGGAIGGILAAERVHRPYVIDHSEDGIVYFVFVGGGAALGVVTGTVVALLWPD